MLTDIWFYAFLIVAALLCFVLARNITDGKTLRTELDAEIVKLKAQWDSFRATQSAAQAVHEANTNAALSANGVNTSNPRAASSS